MQLGKVVPNARQGPDGHAETRILILAVPRQSNSKQAWQATRRPLVDVERAR